MSRGMAIAFLVVGSLIVLATVLFWAWLIMLGCAYGSTSMRGCDWVVPGALFTQDALWFWPFFIFGAVVAMMGWRNL